MTPQPIEQGIPNSDIAGTVAHAQWALVLKRIFGRSLMDMAVLMLITVIFSNLRTPEHLLGDPDIWWHAANARALCTTHHFIQADAYSFTVFGQPWVDPEWLSELVYWFGYKNLGLVGIYLVTLIALTANVLFVYWRSYFKGRNAGVALWMGALGFALMTVNASARTILIAYLAMSAEMAIFEAVERGRTRLLWLLPPLFCMWINLHGSWIIGLGLFVLYILCGLFGVTAGIFQQVAFSTQQRNRLLMVLGVSLPLLMVNPYGWRLLWYPFDMLLNQTLNIGNVQEWQPLNLSWAVGKAALIAIGLTIFANIIHARKWKLYEIAFIFFAWYAAFDHARFTFLAAVLTIPMIAGDVARSFFGSPNPKTIPVMNAIMAAGALLGIAWTFPTEAKLEQGWKAECPLQTIASIQPSWRTLHAEYLGGVMDFEFKPTFIDTRWDIFEHHGVMKDFIDILRLHDSLNLLDKYRIDHVLLRQDEPLSYLLERTPGWTVLKKEGAEKYQYELLGRDAVRPARSTN